MSEKSTKKHKTSEKVVSIFTIVYFRNFTNLEQSRSRRIEVIPRGREERGIATILVL